MFNGIQQFLLLLLLLIFSLQRAFPFNFVMLFFCCWFKQVCYCTMAIVNMLPYYSAIASNHNGDFFDKMLHQAYYYIFVESTHGWRESGANAARIRITYLCIDATSTYMPIQTRRHILHIAMRASKPIL